MTSAEIMQIASIEEFRLVERLFLTGSEKRTVVFTAPDRGAGCTWIVTRAARKLAAHGTTRVCVVDANLRWPALHTAFRMNNERGLLQALMKKDQPIREFIRQVDNSNLCVLTSGGSVTDTHHLLTSETIKNRFAELAREFDFVLLDTPAMKAAVDSGLIARLTDGAVMVVAADATKRTTAENTKMALEIARVPILGAVLNKRTYPIPEAIYQRL